MRDGLETREKIERAALGLFVRQGINGTSIRDVARLAGVSQGAMYNHYKSKEDLALELFSRGWSEMGAELRRRGHSGTTLEEKFEAMVGYVFDRFDKDWTQVSYVFFSRHDNLRRVSVNLPNPYLAFRRVIVDAIQNGEIPRQEAEVATSMVTGAIIQVIDTKILGRIDGNLHGRAGYVAKACVGLLRG
ncbi:MAG: TetR family transcriptional regulator [Gammaproteobacteria bacterium]|nr:TetR/AcrR family transcriptional regulator [Gammaproteobacteria bacterium]NIX11237.1 TetR family transcriptional regulator [Gammaproteobacteria bacterium]